MGQPMELRSPPSELNIAAELTALKTELAMMRRQSALRRKLFFVAATAGAVLLGASALGANLTDCTQQLPLGLFCFAPDAPAHAQEVNGNFKALADEIAASELRSANAIATAVGTVTTRFSAVEWTVNGDGGVITGTTQRTGLSARERVLSGSVAGGCGQSFNGPCNITFPSGYFTSTPRCVAMARVPDTTGYSENVVMTGVNTGGISIYEGQLVGGVTLLFDWICVGT